jgi:hypothetical protein
MPILRLAVLAVLLAACGPAAADTEPGSGDPVLLELFTSQGCSSCPPADALLVEIAGRGDAVVLSQHVDYWNYIGWTDPFSRAEATERQQAYRKALNLRYVYTPQAVIDGVAEMIGSERAKVERQLAVARSRERIEFERTREGGRELVRIPAGQHLYANSVVWAVDIDRRHTTRIERGENKGVELSNANVVRDMRRVGRYTGAALEIPLDLAALRAKGRSGCIILVQALASMRIYGAIEVSADEGS